MALKTLYDKKIYCHNCDKLFTFYYVSKDRTFDYISGKLIFVISCPYCDVIELEEPEMHYVKFFEELKH